MPRLLSTSFILLALVVSAVGAAPTAHAQNADPYGGDTTAAAQDLNTAANSSTVTANPNADPYGGDTTAAAQDLNTAAQSSTAAAKADASTPSPFGSSREATLDESFAKIMNWIASIFAWLVGVAVITLDNAVYYTVVKMGDYVNHLSAVGVTWRIMRDIGNIVLIFGFLAAGIATIINVDMYGWGKKMLPMLLVAAVFINFSLFLAEAVIDTGNLFATQFYTQINGGQPASAKNFDLATIKNEGISNKIMSQLGLATIYGSTLTNSNLLKAGHSVFIGFMSIILFLIVAFVMFSLAFILISRFVILLFLIIVAPIGFAGLAVPKLESTAKLWWGKLFEQTITAPILLLLLYIALAVITDVNFLAFGPKGDWSGFVPEPGGSTNYTGFASLMLSFLVAMGLLLAVVIISKKMSAFGGDMATKWAGRLSFGATAFGASALLNSTAFGARKALQRYAPNNRATRLGARVLRLGEQARMDVRSIPGIGKGLEFGGAGEAAKPIEKSAGGRVRQAGDWWKKSGLESDQQYRQETVIPRLNTEVALALQTGDYRTVSSVLSSMSDKDLETSAVYKALVRNPAAVALLSQARFDKLQQSDALSATQKAALSQARKDGDNPDNVQSRFSTSAVITSGPSAGMTRGQALVGGMNTATRGKLSGNILTETIPPPAGAPAGTPPTVNPRNAILDNLNGSDFDAIRREGGLTQAEKVAVGQYINNLITTAPPTPSAREASIIAAAMAPAIRIYYNLP